MVMRCIALHCLLVIPVCSFVRNKVVVHSAKYLCTCEEDATLINESLQESSLRLYEYHVEGITDFGSRRPSYKGAAKRQQEAEHSHYRAFIPLLSRKPAAPTY